MNTSDRDTTHQSPKTPEGGYGSPTPEDEIPKGAPTNPGSPDPTLRGQESDEQSLGEDEPGAGRLGGTDDQLREELTRADENVRGVDTDNDTPLEAPSTDAPMNDDNAGPTRPERESFSSESDDDASGGS